MNTENLLTEQRNRRSMHIDREDTMTMVENINREDAKVARAVSKELPVIAEAIDASYPRIEAGGRLIYVGAGTSGRLGVIDATELQPTYGLTADQTFGLIAGGLSAMDHTVEGAEDSMEMGQVEIADHHVNQQDVVIGIAASGKTPYTIGALRFAKEQGALCIALTCVSNSELGRKADYEISPIVGPEIITGATLMKAGTAQKMVLNMLSTGMMVKSGKVYQNLMINVVPTNEKTMERAKSIIALATDTSEIAAERALSLTDNNVPLAIVLIETKGTLVEAKKLLDEANGHVEQAVQLSHQLDE